MSGWLSVSRGGAQNALEGLQPHCLLGGTCTSLLMRLVLNTVTVADSAVKDSMHRENPAVRQSRERGVRMCCGVRLRATRRIGSPGAAILKNRDQSGRVWGVRFLNWVVERHFFDSRNQFETGSVRWQHLFAFKVDKRCLLAGKAMVVGSGT